jgi:hypothetical protein
MAFASLRAGKKERVRLEGPCELDRAEIRMLLNTPPTVRCSIYRTKSSASINDDRLATYFGLYYYEPPTWVFHHPLFLELCF